MKKSAHYSVHFPHYAILHFIFDTMRCCWNIWLIVAYNWPINFALFKITLFNSVTKTSTVRRVSISMVLWWSVAAGLACNSGFKLSLGETSPLKTCQAYLVLEVPLPCSLASYIEGFPNFWAYWIAENFLCWIIQSEFIPSLGILDVTSEEKCLPWDKQLRKNSDVRFPLPPPQPPSPPTPSTGNGITAICEAAPKPEPSWFDSAMRTNLSMIHFVGKLLAARLAC